MRSIYIYSESPHQAKTLIKKHPRLLSRAVVIKSLKDFDFIRRKSVVVSIGKYWRRADFNDFFGEGIFYTMDAMIFYDNELSDKKELARLKGFLNDD